MGKLRVMVVDGDAGARRKIGRALESDPDVDLVGASCFGAMAVEKLGRLRPDVVVLGVHPAAEEAWEALGLLRAACPELPILVVSPEARRGSPTSLDALNGGATGCAAYTEIDAPEALRAELMARVRALGLPRAAGPDVASRRGPGPSAGDGRIEAVVIGASTGGPNGLAAIMESIPADFPAPILIAQHMPAHFTRSLSERLDSLMSIPVREAADGELARPGTAWVAPGGRHLEAIRARGGLRLRLDDGPPENSCRPSVDVLFRSAARAVGGRALGVVLTGMGCDGLRGCRAIREAGGSVLVQDEATSVVWGMPGHVAEAGLADAVLPIGAIGPAIVRLASTDPAVRGGR